MPTKRGCKIGIWLLLAALFTGTPLAAHDRSGAGTAKETRATGAVHQIADNPAAEPAEPAKSTCGIEKQTHVFAVKGQDTLRLDLYAAPRTDSLTRPCLVFVFGGGFVSGQRDARDFRPFFDHFVRKGFAVVSIDYRLGMKQARESGAIDGEGIIAALETTVSMATEDLYDATACICRHAPEWGIDTSRIVTCGSSAGAITVLTGEYGNCNGSPAAHRLPEGFRYAGVIAFAGAICERGELRWEHAPAPMLLFHGDADRNVPYDKVSHEGIALYGSKHIARSLTGNRYPHWFYSAADTDHSMAWRPMRENLAEIDTFLEKLVLARKPLILDTRVSPLDAEPQPEEFTLSDYLETNYGN